MLELSQISPSDPITIGRFDIILAMANTMKSCHVFCASDNGFLYGAPEEGYALYVLPIPREYIPSRSFIFRVDSFDKDKVEQIQMIQNFVLYPDMQTLIFPANVMIMPGGREKALADMNYFILYEDHSEKAIPFPTLFNLIGGMADIQKLLGPSTVFSHVEIEEAVATVVANKISEGRRLLVLTTPEGKRYEMYVFKNLFNLNKGDQLDIAVRDRLDNYRLFQADFTVTKKTNPLKGILDRYTIHVYTQYIHLY